MNKVKFRLRDADEVQTVSVGSVPNDAVFRVDGENYKRVTAFDTTVAAAAMHIESHRGAYLDRQARVSMVRTRKRLGSEALDDSDCNGTVFADAAGELFIVGPYSLIHLESGRSAYVEPSDVGPDDQLIELIDGYVEVVEAADIEVYDSDD